MNTQRKARAPTPRAHGAALYLLMAAMTIIGAFLAVLLCRDLVEAFRRSVVTNGEWATRAADYSKLAQMATAANAPGNNVFETKDIAGERAKLARLVTEFEAQHAHVVAEA